MSQLNPTAVGLWVISAGIGWLIGGINGAVIGGIIMLSISLLIEFFK